MGRNEVESGLEIANIATQEQAVEFLETQSEERKEDLDANRIRAGRSLVKTYMLEHSAGTSERMRLRRVFERSGIMLQPMAGEFEKIAA